jgi:hypothetical protein
VVGAAAVGAAVGIGSRVGVSVGGSRVAVGGASITGGGVCVGGGSVAVGAAVGVSVGKSFVSVGCTVGGGVGCAVRDGAAVDEGRSVGRSLPQPVTQALARRIIIMIASFFCMRIYLNLFGSIGEFSICLRSPWPLFPHRYVEDWFVSLTSIPHKADPRIIQLNDLTVRQMRYGFARDFHEFRSGRVSRSYSLLQAGVVTRGGGARRRLSQVPLQADVAVGR